MKIWAFPFLSMLADATSNHFQERIFNGTDCRDDERQYHVFVEISQKPINYCGGSLLNNRWVITAAHCQPKGFIKKPLTLKFGRTPAHPIVANLPPERLRVVPGKHQFVCKHDRKKYDIMLLKLDPPLNGNLVNHRTTINFPPYPCQKPAVGEEIHVAGWGDTSGTSMPNHLQCASMTVKSCRGTIISNGFTYSDDALVFYSRPTLDTRPGDSGGGVEYKGLLHGVHVRGGNSPCKTLAEGVNVCYKPIRDWIDDTMLRNP